MSADEAPPHVQPGSELAPESSRRCPAGAPRADDAAIVGVRLPGSPRVHFLGAERGVPSVGDVVHVPENLGALVGVVVIAPEQVRWTGRLSSQPLMAPAFSLVEPDAKASHPRNAIAAARPYLGNAGALVGALVGALGPPRGETADGAGIDRENRRLDRARAGLPRLGQPVETPFGRGSIVALRVDERTATVRLEEAGDERTVPIAGSTDGGVGGAVAVPAVRTDSQAAPGGTGT